MIHFTFHTILTFISSVVFLSNIHCYFKKEILVIIRSILILFIVFTVCNLKAFNITFSVDMNNESVSSNGVHLAGNFQSEAGFKEDWNPSITQMSDVDGDGIFSITLDIPAGYWEFKYVNGNVWTNAENAQGSCTVGGTNNRYFTITNSDSILDLVIFNKCPQSSDNNEFNYPDTTGALKWWNHRVFYEIFVRSFADSDGDGIGDFQGIIDNINYLNDNNPNTNTDLGIGGIWLMPMMESSSYHGYDVEDYYSVETDYGSMDDFQRLLDTCHAHGINIIIDLVINHCSSNSNWFKKSASNDSQYKDWFIWNENPPNEKGPWGQTVWHWNAQRQSYYYGLFWSGMPDLNYDEPEVYSAIEKITEFWLDLGVDGFRLDAIKYLDEDPNLMENTPETFAVLKKLRNHVDGINPNSFMVGEVWDATPKILPYVSDTTLNSCFDFDLAGRIAAAVINNDGTGVTDHVKYMQSVYPRSQYSTFLTNHDQDRIYSVLNDDAKMKMATSIYLSLPGIPFLYYGEEISLTGVGDHLNIRTPMQWNGNSQAGFTLGTPWRGFAQDYTKNNVMLQQLDSQSVWNHYQKWIHLRNSNTSLQTGIYWPVNMDNASILSYFRTHARYNESENVLVIHNLANSDRSITIPSSKTPLDSGRYFVYNGFDEIKIGAAEVDVNGKILKWDLDSNLGPMQSAVIKFSKTELLSNSIEKIHNHCSIFPNPVSDVLNINCPKGAKYLVYSIAGRTILEGVKSTKENIKLKLDSLSEGVYLITVSGDNFKYSEKFIVSSK